MTVRSPKIPKTSPRPSVTLSDSLPQHDVLNLQHSVGNQHTMRLLQRGVTAVIQRAPPTENEIRLFVQNNAPNDSETKTKYKERIIRMMNNGKDKEDRVTKGMVSPVIDDVYPDRFDTSSAHGQLTVNGITNDTLPLNVKQSLIAALKSGNSSRVSRAYIFSFDRTGQIVRAFLHIDFTGESHGTTPTPHAQLIFLALPSGETEKRTDIHALTEQEITTTIADFNTIPVWLTQWVSGVLGGVVFTGAESKPGTHL